MNNGSFQMTAKGLERLKEQLRYLKEVKRQEITENMGTALADGDLRESAAYDEARMAQSENEVRIADLEELIARAVIVERAEGDEEIAMLGATLELEDEKGRREVFHLVGTHEADFLENRVSDDSPFGRSMLGKRAGDQVVVNGNSGKSVFKVVAVTFD